MFTTMGRSALVTTTALACIGVSAPAAAQIRNFDVPAQAVQSGITALGRQANIQIVAARRDTRGKRANALRGMMTVDQAISRMLAGTGLTSMKTGAQTYAVVAMQAPAMMHASSAMVAAVPTGGDDGQAQAAPAAASDASDAGEDAANAEILVTGSRLDRAGFDAPTPTTVVGGAELRLGNRPSIAQVLNDLPQFRAAGTPAQTTGNTDNSYSAADLRGLGSTRTLTLVNGHRFNGTNDLNNVPQGIIKRVEVVTGGASAAWGSGAVAGVVNIILDDELKGLSLSAQNGISSRGDGMRYGFSGSYGTEFADGRGHFMVAAEFVRDRGIYGRNDGSRPNLDAALYTMADGRLLLANDVNFTDAGPGGIITSGALAGYAFNRDGSATPLVAGSLRNATTTVGGTGRSVRDYLPVISPFHRATAYARASYELNESTKIWVDASFSRMWDDFLSFPESTRATATTGGLVFQKDNAFLTPAVRAALASGPQTFRVGYIFGDQGGFETYGYHRENYEGAIGIDGSLGGSWKYSAYYDHGEFHNDQAFYNQRITANFNDAIDAVTNASGQIVCRVALTNPNTACRPLNLFGSGNSSPEALAYAFAGRDQVYHLTTQKLDTAGASVRGDPFSTWAGPVSFAAGVDVRWEKFITNKIDPLSTARALGSYNAAPTNGGFSVKEGFVELAVPLLNIPGTAVLDVSGAARYSDYSTSGGIWSWKTGGTLRLVDDILLRAVYSRDIRSPSIAELFTTRTTAYATVIDPFRANESVSVVRYGGGNPDLLPEIAHTLTLGGSYAPSFIPGLNLSVDFYKIDIDDVIATIAPQDALNQCFAGNSAACAAITRDSTGQITQLVATFINLAYYKTRGVDFEASYVLPLERLNQSMDGSLRFRLLATHVNQLRINDGVNSYDRAGDVGDNATFTTPKWKASGSVSYQRENFGIDMRVRYIGGGTFNNLQPIINNRVKSRTYVDLGAQFNVGNFTVFGNVNNLFDRDPPFVTYGSAIYDAVGRYFSGGVKVKL